jgi:hypothetical protein
MKASSDERHFLSGLYQVFITLHQLLFNLVRWLS